MTSDFRPPTSDFRPPASDFRPPSSVFRHGQAILELVVGLVAMLVIIAGMLQIGALNRLHTRAMIKARSQAATFTLSSATPVSDAQYILDCTPGDDGRAYTRDDGRRPAFFGNFQDRVLDHAQAPTLPLRDARPGNPVDNLTSVQGFDMVHGYQTYATNLFPIVRDLIYSANSIEVRADVFMTRLWGLP